MNKHFNDNNKKDALERLYSLFPSSYLTLLSIIQATVLGYLVWMCEEKFNTFSSIHYILIGITFLTIVAAWNEYVMGVAAFVWIPNLVDSLIPFVLGASEILLIHTISLEFKLWLFVAAVVCLIAAMAFVNMYRRASNELNKNKEILNRLKFYIWFNPLYCICGALIFVILGLYLFDGSDSNKIIFVYIIVPLIFLIGFLIRAVLYWKQITSFIKSEKNFEKL